MRRFRLRLTKQWRPLPLPVTFEDKRRTARCTRPYQSQDDEEVGRSACYTKSVRRYPAVPLHMRFASPSKRRGPALCLGVFLRRTYSTVQGGMPINRAHAAREAVEVVGSGTRGVEPV
jgi:hypothetical protein